MVEFKNKLTVLKNKEEEITYVKLLIHVIDTVTKKEDVLSSNIRLDLKVLDLLEKVKTNAVVSIPKEDLIRLSIKLPNIVWLWKHKDIIVFEDYFLSLLK